MKLTDIHVTNTLRGRLAEGHPWVYRNHIAGMPYIPSGTWVRVHCGGWQGIGLWDAQSPIAVRLFSRSTIPDRRWVRERVHAAWLLRGSVRATDTNAYRWIFGESDGLPGITVDLYGAFAVIQTYADSVATLIPLVVEALHKETHLRGILIRPRGQQDTEDYQDRASKIERLWGEWPPDELTVQEHGLQFRANLFTGQKTGLFLDHRENRYTLQSFTAGKSVLNCFAYTGAFSVYALRGGASAVTSCDIAPDAVEDARVNFRLNGYDPDEHEFVAADVFELLTKYAAAKRTFDIIVLDPPSFARARKHVEVAVRAYTRLNQLALACIAPDGLLVSASCTSQVSVDMFRGMLATAASRSNRVLRLIHEAGQPPDHPVAAHFPEGRYLKFMIGHVGEPV